MRGRKPKTIVDEKARKSQRERSKKAIEMTKNVQELSIEPPAYFSDLAAAVWKRIIPILKATNTVKQSDQTVIEAFCLNYESMVLSYRDIQEHGQQQAIFKTVILPTGEVVKDANGKPKADFLGYKRNPATQIFDNATSKIKALASELGLTPASRAQLVSLVPDKSDGVDIEKALKAFM